MPQGILWVSSRIVRPENLAPETLIEWYENVMPPCNPYKHLFFLCPDRWRMKGGEDNGES